MSDPQSPYGQSPYGQNPNPYGQNPYGAPGPSTNPSNTLSIIGIVCGAIAFLFCPIGFGAAGLILGGIAKSKGERLANVALIVAGIGLVVGLIFGIVVAKSVMN